MWSFVQQSTCFTNFRQEKLCFRVLVGAPFLLRAASLGLLWPVKPITSRALPAAFVYLPRCVWLRYKLKSSGLK